MATPDAFPHIPTSGPRTTRETPQTVNDRSSRDVDYSPVTLTRSERRCILVREWLSSTNLKEAPATSSIWSRPNHTTARPARATVRAEDTRASSEPPDGRLFAEPTNQERPPLRYSRRATARSVSVAQGNSLEGESDNDDRVGLHTSEPLSRYDEPPVVSVPVGKRRRRQKLKLFECAICRQDLPQDFVTIVDTCGHRFCVECMRNHVISQVQQQKHPIPCPSCMASSSFSELGGHYIKEILGVPDETYYKLEDLELGLSAVKFQCRNCDARYPVAKDDFNLQEYISCFRCGARWCCRCNEGVQLDETKAHDASCAYGKETMEGLARRTGWKRCPGCNTMIEKTDGCNHITCKVPGCNTHFCYRCQGIITRSQVPVDVQLAVRQHYRYCELFTYPPVVARDDTPTRFNFLRRLRPMLSV